MALLNPSNDYVFKILFRDPEDEPGLIAMLTAILRPDVPITSAIVLNPEIHDEVADGKAIVLDLMVELADGTTVDVEMETIPAPEFLERLVFYWARSHGRQLATGEGYEKLRRTISIAWVVGRLPRRSRRAMSPRRVHSRFRIQNTETHVDLTDHFEMHVLELPNRKADATLNTDLRRWARFFDRPSEADLADLTSEDPIMAATVDKLRKVSREDTHRYLAESREKGELRVRLGLGGAYREGVEDGRAAGVEEGRAAGIEEGRAAGIAENARAMLRHGVDREVVADVLGVPLDELDAFVAER